MYLIPIKSFWIIFIAVCLIKGIAWFCKTGLKTLSLCEKVAVLISLLFGLFGVDALSFRVFNIILGTYTYKVFEILFIVLLSICGIKIIDIKNIETTKENRIVRLVHLIIVVFSIFDSIVLLLC